MLVVLTGGGTGGHVYPALAAAAELAAPRPQSTGSCTPCAIQLLFVGSQNGMERHLVSRAGLPFAGVAAAPVLGRSALMASKSIFHLGLGLVQATRLLLRHQPAAILATGGYVCVPVVLAGWLLRVPSVVYLPDVEPGWAVRFLSRFASRIAVTSEASCRFLPRHKVVVTGYPVRPELRAATGVAGRRAFGIAADSRVLLVLGGSRGAHRVNLAVHDALPRLLSIAEVIHGCGPADYDWLSRRREELDSVLSARYHLRAYLYEELADAMAAADLVVSRAGASVMGEYPAFGLPSLLVPYPYAGAHQAHNADVLVEHGAAIKVSDAELSADTLLAVVEPLLSDPARLERMAEAARKLDRPQAARALAELVLAVGRGENCLQVEDVR